jgi:mono/diheme cytochrome c family protein
LTLIGLIAAPAPASKPNPSSEHFDKTIKPVLSKSCYACHNQKLKSGDLDLKSFETAEGVAHDTEVWEKVATRMMDGTMPPKGMPRPPQSDVEAIAKWIKEEVTRVELAQKPDPGKITARRLNRAEYNNTIRDLLGIDLKLADDFPQDDSGYGFDNIGDVLSLSPVLLEKYLKAAETAVKVALNGPEKMKPIALRSQPVRAELELKNAPEKEYDESGLSMPNALHANMRFPADGTYTFRVALEGRRPNGSEPVQIGIWVDGKLAGTVPIDAPSDGGSIDLFGAQAETKVHVSAGDHWVAGTLLKLYEGLPANYNGPNPSKRRIPAGRGPRIPEGSTPEQAEKLRKEFEARMARFKVPANRVWVHFIEAQGPFDQKIAPAVESRKRILACGHLEGKHVAGCDRKVLSQFARRAFRRPVTTAELQPYYTLAANARQNGSNFEESIAAGLQAILVSPDFLFRVEKPDVTTAGAAVAPVTQHALASRLSYFLWSSMPDEELLRVADQGQLRKPEVLAAQVRRMLASPKAKALVDNFAGQWLELRRLESHSPDVDKFKDWDEYLRMSMRQETELFFANIVAQDASILEMIDGKYTFVNEKLANFYGLKGVKGTEFQRVDLTGTPRGGLLTQASILTVSSYVNRTSPVLRGKWILENFLNEPIPPPPPNVPLLDEEKIGAGAASFRAQMEEHRANPVCSSCHAKMDPVGFGFENFNAIGQFRTKDGKFDIDPAGTLPDGRGFKSPDDLKALLAQDAPKFAECVTDKMLTYALGRGLERYDRRTVKSIAANIAAKDYKFSSLVLEIVKSLPFQMTRQEQKKS